MRVAVMRVAVMRVAVMRVAVIVSVAATVLGACSAAGDGAVSTTRSEPVTSSETTRTTGTTGTTRATGTTETTGTGPDGAPADCPATDAMADLLGGPVDRTMEGGGSGVGGGLSYDYEGCRYARTDGGSVTVARITVDATEGRSAFARLDDEARADDAEHGFEPVAGLGDAAVRDGPGLVVRLGPRIIFVEVTADPDASDAERTAAREQTAAVARLVVDGGVEVAPGSICTRQRAAVVRAVGPVTGVDQRVGAIGVNDVVFATEGCSMDLADGREVTIGVAQDRRWDAWVKGKAASIFAVTYEGVTIGELTAFDTGDTLVVNDADRPLRIATEDLDLGAAAAAELRIAVAELVLYGG